MANGARGGRQQPPASVAFADALASTDDAYLDCRDLRHPWHVVEWHTQNSGAYVVRTLECARCGTQRHDRWNRNGERVGSHYSYAEGYQFTHLLDASDATAVRREVMRRANITTTRPARRARKG